MSPPARRPASSCEYRDGFGERCTKPKVGGRGTHYCGEHQVLTAKRRKQLQNRRYQKNRRAASKTVKEEVVMVRSDSTLRFALRLMLGKE